MTHIQKIEKELEQQLELDNCLNLYSISEAANAPKLKRATILVAARNFDELQESDSYCDLRDTNPLTARQVSDLVRAAIGQGIAV